MGSVYYSRKIVFHMVIEGESREIIREEHNLTSNDYHAIMRWKFKQEIDIKYENPGITEIREISFQLNGPYLYPSHIDKQKYIILQCKNHECRDKMGKIKVYADSIQSALITYPRCRICNAEMIEWRSIRV